MTVTTWNSSDKSANVSLSGGNLVATATTSAAGGVRGTAVVNSGKAYFETTITYSSITDNFVGVATLAKSLVTTGAGAAWVDVFGGWMYINSGANSGNIGNFNSGDVLCTALDLTNQRVWFRRNNGTWNNSGTADPSSNVGGFDVSALFTGIAAYPHAMFSATGMTDTANFGATAFAQTMPSGYSNWNALAVVPTVAVFAIHAFP